MKTKSQGSASGIPGIRGIASMARAPLAKWGPSTCGLLAVLMVASQSACSKSGKTGNPGEKAAALREGSGHLASDPSTGSAEKPGKPSTIEEFLAECKRIYRQKESDKPSAREFKDLTEQIKKSASRVPDMVLRGLLLNPPTDQLGDPILVDMLQLAISEVLATRSPAAFLEFVGTSRSQISRPISLAGGMASIAKANPKYLAEWVEKDLRENRSANSDQLSSVCAVGLMAMCREAPGEFLSLAQKSVIPWPISGFLTSLAKSHPEEVLRYIDSPTSDPKIVKTAISSMIVAVGDQDPEQAVNLLTRLGDKGDALYAANQFLTSWQAKDPAQAAAYAMKLPPRLLFDFLAGRTPGSISLVKTDPEIVKRIYGGVVLTESNSGRMKDMILTAAKFDPENTLSWVSSMAQSPFTQELLVATAEQSVYGLESTKDCLNYLPDPTSPNYANCLAGIAGAVGALEGRSPEKLGSVLEISQGLPEADRARFLEVALTRAANGSPAAVLGLLDDESAGAQLADQEKSTIAGQAGTSWAHKDVAGAVTWVSSQEEGPVKTAFVRGMATGWLAIDPVAATEWISDLETGEARNEGIKLLVAALRRTDPERAAQWQAELTGSN